MSITTSTHVDRPAPRDIGRPDGDDRFGGIRPPDGFGTARSSGGFGAGSLVDALLGQVTRLDGLRSPAERGPVGDASGTGSDIVLAQADGAFESPFDSYDHVESVKNPDIPVFDIGNPGNIEDPFGINPVQGLEAAIFDALIAREQQQRRQEALSGPPVRTSTFGSMTISEGDGWTSTTDSTTGTTVSDGTNGAGERTTTVSTAQLASAASPRTVTIFTERADGTVTREERETSPTGVTYGTAPEPEPAPEPPAPAPRSTPPRRSSFESDGSQSNGVGSDFSSSDGDPDSGYSSPF